MMIDALIVFVAMACTDALWAIYIRRTGEGRALTAAAFSAALVVLGGLVIVYYTEDHRLLPVAAAGAWLGTFLTVRRDHGKPQ